MEGISRGGDLTPQQPSVDENIDKANQMLDEYGESLSRKEIPMWVVDLIISILKEESFMDKIVARAIEEIQKTELDEQLYKIIADVVKEGIPGEHFEPVIGTALIGIGEELQKAEE